MRGHSQFALWQNVWRDPPRVKCPGGHSAQEDILPSDNGIVKSRTVVEFTSGKGNDTHIAPI